MMASIRCLLLLFVAAICFCRVVQGEKLDPATFFDGSENEAYLDWVEKKATRIYERNEYFPSPAGPFHGAAVHWTIKDDSVYLAVAARTTGWVGFGIAENGGMLGADVVMFRSDTNTLEDAHILDERVPIRDECQSWTLLNSFTDGGFVIFEAVRLLDTGDSQDRPIIDDSTLDVAEHRVIAAWGDDPSFHSPDARVRSAIRFHGTSTVQDFDALVQAEAEGVLDLVAVDYPVKTIDTEYAYFCFSNADLVNMGMPSNTELHAIAFEPIIDPRAAKYVHHFVLYASKETLNNVTCDDSDWIEIAYAWAPGQQRFVLPTNVGGPIGENGFKSFHLEIHYNNPWADTDVLDSSGIRIYFTSVKREYDMGILTLGDPALGLFGQPVGDGLVQHSFDCPASCSTVSLQEPITVIREALHMHQAGKSMYNYQSRDDQVIRFGEAQFYIFDQQGAHIVPQPAFQVQPGDSFRTECYYESNNAETFGLSSQQEMCMAFLFYYPRQQIQVSGFSFPFMCGYNLGSGFCDSEWEQVGLASTDDLNRSFGSFPSDDVCEASVGSTSSAAGSYLDVIGIVPVVVMAIAAFMN